MENSHGIRQLANKPNGRLSGGFSLRRSLEDQGVTTEEGMKAHLSLIHESLRERPSLDITRYRIDADHPNNPASNMG